MPKTQLLTAADMVKIYRLIGECRDDGHDSVAWRRHLLAELNRMIGTLVATSAEFHHCNTADPRPVGDVDLGWDDPKDRAYRMRFMQECEFCEDPHVAAMMLEYKKHPRLMVADRAVIIDDQQWYDSIHFNEYRKPSHSDSSMYMMTPIGGAAADVAFAVGVTRTLHEPQFTQHDRQFFFWLFHELGPLVGKQLAAPSEPSNTALSPRLRQTLQCLLEGDSEKQAALRMGVSRATVHEYVTQLCRHFGVSSRGELLARWLRFTKVPG